MDLDALYHDDFQSSDLEIDDEPEHFASAGSRSIETMLNTAFEARCQSKIGSKKLKYTAKAPGTQYLSALWANRFQLFRESSLGCDRKSVPTADQIIRYLYSIPIQIRGRGEGGAVSFGFVKAGLTYLTNWGIFTFENFRLTPHDTKRISSAMETLVQDGSFTRQPTREEKLWVTSDIAALMIKAVLRDAITNGTLNWDLTIQRVLAVLLLSSIGARSGDIARTNRYKGKQYLSWQDITIRVWPKDPQRLCATISLNYTKGNKHNPDVQLRSEFIEFSDPSTNVLCPIKLLLIYALRTGAVDATSWINLRRDLSSRRIQKLPWKYPHRPVICASIRPGQLDLDEPAGSGMMIKHIRLAAEAAGILKAVIPHDLRRGAAYEATLLKKSIRHGANEAARSVLGHSLNSAERNLTASYTGHSAEPTWAMRLENDITIRANKIIDVAPTSLKRTRASTELITRVCVEEGLDPGKKLDRDKASRQKRTETTTATRATDNKDDALDRFPIDPELENYFLNLPSQEDRLSYGSPSTRLPTPSNLSSVCTVVAGDRNKTPEDAEDFPADSDITGFFQNFSSQQAHLDDDDELAIRETGVSTLDETAEQDDEALAFCGDVLGIGREASVELPNDMDEGLVSALESAPAIIEMEPPILQASPDEFATFLSTVNSYSWNVSREHNAISLPKYANSVGSKDPPSRWRHSCPNDGCQFTALNNHEMERHLKICDVSKTADYKFICNICQARLKSSGSLRDHINDIHNFPPTLCTVQGCTIKTPFTSKYQLRVHMENEHSGWANKTCPVPTCNRADKPFNRLLRLEEHIRKQHPDFPEDQLQAYLPAKKPKVPPYKPQRCSYPDCTNKNVLETRAQMLSHLNEDLEDFAKKYFFQQVTGQAFVSTYQTTFYKTNGYADQAFTYPIITNCLNIVSVVPGMILIDTLGLQGLWMYVLAGLGQKAVKSPTESNTIVAAFMLYSFFYNMGGASIPYLLGTEIPNAALREKTQSVGAAWNVLWAFATNYSIPYMINAIHFQVGWIFGSISLLALVVTFLILPETKGRALEEIDAIFEVSFNPFRPSKIPWTDAERRVGQLEGEKMGPGSESGKAVDASEDPEVRHVQA
ncbi:uncharacterized protein E0L32_005721 [Thyridium curvatum]|uniref:C2H2-type domain-containing protein n=1 Tax=Thyridium curvatum TaxID=1093900 RepID=A0A507B229_9PEZI|nr:uncharacterized protein E0L32_005721 [Thyridium curvatum]TPX13777.1 hypothetical protein E0L32_005721 [Thyridium curvatum]